ncbi:MAG: hypothetical protein ACREUG_00570, partial [Steroidobacteraceae bacterium]
MDPETPDAPESAAVPETPKDTGAELLAAVNEAIDAETTATARETPSASPETPEPSGEPGAAAGETERGGGETPPGEKPSAAAPEKGAEKGKPASTEEKPGAAKADPVNDPIPEDVQGRTRERMQQLITRVKESSGERDRIQKERDDLVGMVAETRASPEQFNDSLQY